MPGKNLTRDEARERADLLVRRRRTTSTLDLTTGPDDLPRPRTTVRFTPRPSPAPRPSSTSSRGTVEAVTLNGASLDPADALRRRPDRAAGLRRRERARRRRHRRLHEHRRGPAPLRRPGRRRGLPLHASSRCPTRRRDVRRLRAARPQGHVRLHGDRPGPLAGRLQLADARARPPAGDGVADAGASRRRRAISSLHHRPRRRARTTCVRDERHEPRRATVPLGVFCRRSLTAVPRRRQHLRPAPSAGFAFFEERVRPAPTRSPSTTSSSRPSTTRARWRTPARVTFTEIYVFRVQGHRGARRAPRPDDPARAGPHVVRRPGDHALVGRPVAQRVLRRVGLHDRARPRPPSWTERLDDVRHLREGLGLPPGPAALDPPDRRRHPRPGGRRGQLRRHHLRQGRLGAQAARRLRRARARSSPGLRAYFAKHAWGNTTLRRPARRARGHLRPRPVDLVASSGWRPPGSTRCAPRSRSTTQGVITAAAVAADRARGLPDAAPAPPRDRLLRPARTAGWCAPTGSSSTSTASAPRCPSWSAAPQPDLLLVNDDDLAYAKIRLDERSLGHRRGAPARLRRQRCPARWCWARRGT